MELQKPEASCNNHKKKIRESNLFSNFFTAEIAEFANSSEKNIFFSKLNSELRN